MTAITIRDVPEPVIRNLKRKAADAGKSLQAYLLELVTFEGSKPSLAEMMDRLDRETVTKVSVRDVLDAIDAGRERGCCTTTSALTAPSTSPSPKPSISR